MRKKVISLLLAAIVLLCCGCTIETNTVRIGTAGIGGIYNEFGNAIAQVSADENGIDFEVRTTKGSSANLRLLSRNYLELAIAQADIVDDAYYATGTFDGKDQYRGYKAVAGLYTEVCQIIVRADSNIKSVEDMLGKTIAIGEKDSGSEQNAKEILSVYGLSEDMVSEVNLTYAESAKQLSEGKIDAFFCTSGTGATAIEELAKICEIRLLDIDSKATEKIKTAYKFYNDYTIPANTYSGQTEEVKTLGVKSVLLASDCLTDATVEEITRMVFENADKLQYTVSAPLELDEATAVSGITIPFHKGAANYYSSKNITVNTD